MTDQKHTKELLELDRRLGDLILQATTERSHYYTASILKEAKATILALHRQRDELREALNKLNALCYAKHLGEGASDLFIEIEKLLTKTKGAV